MSRSQSAQTETPVVDNEISRTIESEPKSDTEDEKKKRKFNGWQIFGISIGAIFGAFSIGAIGAALDDEDD